MINIKKLANIINYPKYKKLFKIILSIVLISIIGFSGYKYYKYHKNKLIIKTLFERACYMEREMKIPHKFLAAGLWLKFVDIAEKTYYSNHSREYIEPERLSQNIRSDFKIINELSKVNSKAEDFIKNFSTKYLATLDSTYFKYQFELSSDKKNYEIKLLENQDINFDRDNSDYFLFKNDTGLDRVIFFDNDNKMNFQGFIAFYTQELFAKMLEDIK